MMDTHTHLNFKAFASTWKDVVREAVAEGIERMMVVGTDIETSKKAVAMAQEDSHLFASVGVHPHHAQALLKNHLIDLKQLAEIRAVLEEMLTDERVVAIGEVGLDNHEYRMTKYEQTDENDQQLLQEIQKQLFLLQVELAATYNKPLIMHSREAGRSVLELLKNFKKNTNKPVKGVFHCFDGSKKYAKAILEEGFYISFTGNITFVADRAEVAKEVPLDRLLLETDSPYMSPKPKRGLVNTPSSVKIVARCHAQDRNLSVEAVEKQTDLNATALFFSSKND